jgi:hypothetical protein
MERIQMKLKQKQEEKIRKEEKMKEDWEKVKRIESLRQTQIF